MADAPQLCSDESYDITPRCSRGQNKRSGNCISPHDKDCRLHPSKDRSNQLWRQISAMSSWKLRWKLWNSSPPALVEGRSEGREDTRASSATKLWTRSPHHRKCCPECGSGRSGCTIQTGRGGAGIRIMLQFSSRDNLLPTTSKACPVLANSFSVDLQLCDQEDDFRSIMCTIRSDISCRLNVDKEEELLLQSWSEDGHWGELSTQLSALCDANRTRKQCEICGEYSLSRNRGGGRQSAPVHTIKVRICRAELLHLLDDTLPCVWS